MEGNIAKTGLQATESLNQQYQELLQLLGQGNLLYDKSTGKDPSTVPEKCENTNKRVEELITSMKGHLKVIRQAYQHCQDQRTLNGHKMLKLDDLLSPDFKNPTDREASPEYERLHKQLQQKNADLKVVIDDVREMISLINQLPT